MTDGLTVTYPTMAPHVAYHRLASIKGMLKLESKGMKTRGGALRPRIAAEFGLKPRDPFDKFIATIQKLMDDAIAEQEPKC